MDERHLCQRRRLQSVGRETRQASDQHRGTVMRARSFRYIAPIVLAACTALLQSQTLPLEPIHETGASVTGAFEGWFKNPDGTFSLLLGYFNRNTKQELDIPIGPNNRVEPGGPDRGQPTHFLPGRGWGMFTVKVPADFGENKVTWTLR